MFEKNISSFLNKFKSLDIFTKPLEDFQEKTLYGGLVTILCWVTILYLTFWECYYYMKPSWKEEIFVDVSGASKLQINLDIVVTNISCDYLSLDAVDSSGDQHLHIDYNIYKRRLNLHGVPIEEPQKEDLKPVNKIMVTKKQENSSEECGNCYGAGEPGQCCNTCMEVKEAYRKMNWNYVSANFNQCREEPNSNSIFKEGCQLYGTMEVNRVGGSFHIAPGQSFSISHIHVHDVQPYSSHMFNTTHHIRHLSFGRKIKQADGPFQIHPLDGHWGLAKEGAMMFNYYIKLIPTVIERIDGYVLHSNQFSVTKFEKRLSVSSGEGGMPGIFFSYELSPLMVKRTEQNKSLGHLIMTLLSYISGVYIAALLIDSFMHRTIKYIEKVEIGKQN